MHLDFPYLETEIITQAHLFINKQLHKMMLHQVLLSAVLVFNNFCRIRNMDIKNNIIKMYVKSKNIEKYVVEDIPS